MTVTATNKVTGEIVELEVTDLKSLMTAYTTAQEYEKLAKNLKDQLKKELDKYLDERGKSEELDGKQFKTITIQRMTYDKAALREVLDEDTYDQFMKPDKTGIDNFLKDNLETLGEDSTKIRNAMVPDGKPYTQVKLEKLTRE